MFQFHGGVGWNGRSSQATTDDMRMSIKKYFMSCKCLRKTNFHNSSL